MLSSKNVRGCADWERCAKEFACETRWKNLSSSSVAGKHLQPLRRTLVCHEASAQCQPRAKKRLASSVVSEVLPSNLCGKCHLVVHITNVL